MILYIYTHTYPLREGDCPVRKLWLLVFSGILIFVGKLTSRYRSRAKVLPEYSQRKLLPWLFGKLRTGEQRKIHGWKLLFELLKIQPVQENRVNSTELRDAVVVVEFENGTLGYTWSMPLLTENTDPERIRWPLWDSRNIWLPTQCLTTCKQQNLRSGCLCRFATQASWTLHDDK